MLGPSSRGRSPSQSGRPCDATSASPIATCCRPENGRARHDASSSRAARSERDRWCAPDLERADQVTETNCVDAWRANKILGKRARGRTLELDGRRERWAKTEPGPLLARWLALAPRPS